MQRNGDLRAASAKTSESEAALLGNIAVRYRQTKLTWDASAMLITNHDEANKWLRREYRDGWDINPVA